MIGASALVAAPVPASARASARALNIAMFSYGLPFPGLKRGGIEQVAHDLGNALVDRGHAVRIFTYDPKPASARYTTVTLPARGFVTSWLGRRLTMGYLGNVLALLAPYGGADAIISHGDSLLLPLRGTPVVRIMHGSAWEEARSATSILRKLLQTGVYLQELATACLQPAIGISENTRRFNPFVREVIPIGIDLRVFRPDPARRSARPSILFVGALDGRKRGRWLIERFVRDIRPEFPDAELHMVTTPGAPVEGVTYHTGVPADALVTLYQQSWVYASPSTYEGFGLPYVEALACGTPVVATTNPGSREVLASTAGGRLVADDEFAATIGLVLRTPALGQRMAAAGIAHAAQFDIASTAVRYEAVLRRLVA